MNTVPKHVKRIFQPHPVIKFSSMNSRSKKKQTATSCHVQKELQYIRVI